MSVRVAAALSEHPLPTHAVGECVGQVLEGLGDRPDLLLVAVTGPLLGALEDSVRTARSLLEPATTLGVGAVSVLGGPREVEHRGAVVMWAARLEGLPPVRPVRLEVSPGPDGPVVGGLESLEGTTGTLLLLGDPFSLPVDDVLASLQRRAPALTVVGGMASAAAHPGGNRLSLDGAQHTSGAVGVLLDPEVPVRTVVSQGCRPVGRPMTVTAARGHLVDALAGAPASERLREVLTDLDPVDQQLAATRLHLGRVVDERQVDPGRGDLLVRSILGVEAGTGAVAVADHLAVGDTVQFAVRDAVSADEDLRSLLDGERAAGALVFTCNGRGMRMFATPDHDAATVHEALAGAPVAGMFCAGELGPVGGRSFLHSFTASVVLVG